MTQPSPPQSALYKISCATCKASTEMIVPATSLRVSHVCYTSPAFAWTPVMEGTGLR